MRATASPMPAKRIAAECARRGDAAVIAGCVALLTGRPDDVDDQLITVLGGDAAEHVLDGGEGGRSGYWPRVWAARGLLHAWDDRAAGTDRASTADDAAGRDRASTADDAAGRDRVAGTDAAAAALIVALSDRAWRVRELAARVIAAHRVGLALDAVAALRDDPVPRVRVAADRAVVLLIATNA